jgi:Kef-type K+ transport system membrane component KefB/mannitol/fructose-specific phosphotransferase system IIA component (Ntr-type)
MDITLPVTDPVLIVAITMGILLLGPLLFERFRLPGLVGLIALGAVAGPSVTGLLERDATFQLLGTFGLLYLMFVAGVTLDLGEFARQRTRAIGFGLVSFALPMTLALIFAPMLLGLPLVAAALLGSIVGSHTLLALPLATRLGVAKNTALVVATGATLVTDLASLLILAVVQGMQSGEAGWAYWLQFEGLTIAWAVFVLWVLPKVARAFFRRVRREDDQAFAFLLAAVFLSAWLASLVGLAPIIGAFVSGIALNRLVPKKSPLMTRLRFVGDAIFIPFFLVSVGLLVDVRVLGSLEVWGLALFFFALVVLGKGGAALLARPLFGFTAEESLTVAGLTMPQAAATLAVTLIGFEIGLFSQTAVNAVVVLIVLTCFIGPLLVRRFGTQLALTEADRPYEPASAPERILVPLANPETAEELMELALLMRSPESEESVFPLSIARGGHDEAAHVAEAERVMQRAVLHATAADIPVTPTVRIDGNATEGILRAVRELRVSEIVAGWSGTPTAGDRAFGGILDGVLAGSRAMTVVARLSKPLAAATRLVVLVPPLVWREAGFARALRTLAVLATQKGLSVVVVPVEEDRKMVQERIKQTRPPLEAEMRPLSDWRDVVGTLDGAVAEGDVIALLSVREGTLAWRPALYRLPRILAQRFEDTDLLTLYLSEVEVAAQAARAVDGEGDDDIDLPAEHIDLDLHPAAPEAMLRQLFYGAFPDHPGRARDLAAAAVEAHLEDAPEIMPGVVFYHAHLDEVEAPLTFVGVTASGAALPGAGSPTRVVLALLAPTDMAPDDYLRHLAVVAQLVRSEDTVDALVDAESPEAARELLLDGLRADALREA